MVHDSRSRGTGPSEGSGRGPDKGLDEGPGKSLGKGLNSRLSRDSVCSPRWKRRQSASTDLGDFGGTGDFEDVAGSVS